MKKDTYIRRRTTLKKEMGSGLLLFLGNDEVGMNYADNTYRFRQNSTFLYFSVSTMPDWLLLSTLITTQRLFLAMN